MTRPSVILLARNGDEIANRDVRFAGVIQGFIPAFRCAFVLKDILDRTI